MSRRACGSAALRLGGFAALRLCGFAVLRLCGLRVPWQLCGFAALRLCGLRVPWRLCGFAALRLCGLRVPWRLCGFDAFQGARVYPNPHAMQFLADRSNETAQHAALLRTTNALTLIIVNSNILQTFNHERGDFAFSLSIQPIFPTIFGYPHKDFNHPPLLDHIQLET